MILLQWGELFQGFYTQKIEHWFYPSKRARYGLLQFLFSTGKMCKFSKTLYNRQLIQFVRISVEIVVCFIRYQNCMKVIINYTFHGCLVSAFNIFVQLMFTRCLELYTECILSQYHWDKAVSFSRKISVSRQNNHWLSQTWSSLL